jgi:hypothetical protein
LPGKYPILECAPYRLWEFRVLIYRLLDEAAVAEEAAEEVTDEVVSDKVANEVADEVAGVVETECENFCQRLTTRLDKVPEFDGGRSAEIIAHEVSQFQGRLIDRLLTADESSDDSSDTATVILSDGETAVFLDNEMESDDDFYQRRYGC